MNRPTRDEFDAKSARTRQPLPLWAGAFDRATMELTPDVIGAYMLILMAMWETKSCDLPADEKILARIARVSPTIWRRKMAPVILPLLSEENSRIFSEKLQENAEKTEEYCRKQHERKLGKSAPKSLKENDTGTTTDKSTEETADQSGENPKPLTYRSKEEEERARGDENPPSSDLFLNVLAACGLTGGPLPTYWMPPAAEVHVNRWRQLGLSEAEILAVVRESQRDKPDKPRGPKAFDAAMQRLSAAKTAPVHQPQNARAGNRSHERQAFDRSIAELSAGLSAGTVKLDDSDRDPFAARRG